MTRPARTAGVRVALVDVDEDATAHQRPSAASQPRMWPTGRMSIMGRAVPRLAGATVSPRRRQCQAPPGRRPAGSLSRGLVGCAGLDGAAGGRICAPERLARAGASPTRSGPEGSSRNESRLGRRPASHRCRRRRTSRGPFL